MFHQFMSICLMAFIIIFYVKLLLTDVYGIIIAHLVLIGRKKSVFK